VPYVSVPALQELLSRDQQHTGTAAALAPAVLAERVATAQREVDARLAAAGYSPFTDPVPDLVVDITAAIAAYLADLTYRQNKAPTSQLDPVLQRYQWAQRLLADIAANRAVIPGVDPPGEPAAGDGGADVVAVIQPYEGRLFAPDDLLGQGVDRDPWPW
jgi:hypothetical protein